MNKLEPSGGKTKSKDDKRNGLYISTVKDARKSLEKIFKNSYRA